MDTAVYEWPCHAIISGAGGDEGRCHGRVVSNSKFCTYCGKKAQRPSCPGCFSHTKSYPSQKFCMECGLSLKDLVKPHVTEDAATLEPSPLNTNLGEQAPANETIPDNVPRSAAQLEKLCKTGDTKVASTHGDINSTQVVTKRGASLATISPVPIPLGEVPDCSMPQNTNEKDGRKEAIPDATFCLQSEDVVNSQLDDPNGNNHTAISDLQPQVSASAIADPAVTSSQSDIGSASEMVNISCQSITIPEASNANVQGPSCEEIERQGHGTDSSGDSSSPEKTHDLMQKIDTINAGAVWNKSPNANVIQGAETQDSLSEKDSPVEHEVSLRSEDVGSSQSDEPKANIHTAVLDIQPQPVSAGAMAYPAVTSSQSDNGSAREMVNTWHKIEISEAGASHGGQESPCEEVKRQGHGTNNTGDSSSPKLVHKMHPYRKPENAPEYVQPSPVNNKEEHTEKNGNSSLKDAMPSEIVNDVTPIPVEFYVALHPNFKYQRNKTVVTVRFTRHDLGGPDNVHHRMEFVKNLRNNYVLMKYAMKIPFKFIKDGCKYQYCVNDGIEAAPTYTSGNIPQKRLVKCVDVPEGMLSSMTQYQYGGIAVLPKSQVSRWMSKVGNYFFGPSGQPPTELALDYMMDVIWTEDKASCLVRNVLALNNAMTTWPCVLKDKEYSQQFYLTNKLLQVIKDTARNSGKRTHHIANPGNSGGCLGKSMAMVILVTKYALLLDKYTFIALCEGLVMCDKEAKSCPEYEDLFGLHFMENERSMLADSLVKFITCYPSRFDYTPEWLWCVPLLHFLTKECEPLKTPPAFHSIEHCTESWWGILWIVNWVECFKLMYGAYQKVPIKDLLLGISKLAHVDPLLWRTTLASLNHKYMKAIFSVPSVPMDAALAMLHYHFKMGNVTVQDLQARLKDLIGKARTFKESIPSEPKDMELQEKNHQMYVMARLICRDSLCWFNQNLQNLANQNWKDGDILAQILELTLEIDIICHATSDKDSESDRTSSGQSFEDTINHVLWILEQHLPPNLMDKTELQLQIRSKLFHLCTLKHHRSDSCRKTLTEELKEKIHKLEWVNVLKIYGNNVKAKNHERTLVDIFTEHAFQAAKNILQDGKSVDQSAMRQVGDIFSKVLMEEWPKISDGTASLDEEISLRHSLESPSFWRFLQMFDGHSPTMFTECGTKCLKHVASLHTQSLELLVSGEIKIQRLRMLLDHENNFIANMEALDKYWTKDISDAQTLKLILQARREEIGQFETCCKQIRHFISISQNLGFECNSLDSMLRESDQPDLTLKCICGSPMVYDQVQKSMVPPLPNITFFKLVPERMGVVSDLFRVKDSFVFGQILKATARELKVSEARDLDEFFTNLWPKTWHSWQTVCERMTDGSITIGEIDNHLKNVDGQKLLVEISVMLPETHKGAAAERRKKQIEDYRKLSLSEKAARAVQDFQHQYGLKGNFQSLENIIRMATLDKKTPLSSITADLVQVADSLKDFNEPRLQCLKEFIQCKPLVEWIRKNVENPQEMKTFVDLALIAVSGRDDEDMEKVSCLHAAVTGFIPFIYFIEPQSNYKNFLKQCEYVWQALEADPHLPVKLIDSNRSLEWLKDMKETQGDVEKNALKQMAEIYERGIYIIERRGDGPIQLMTMDDLVRVDVPGEKTACRYSWSQLKELQSKLMLVAGKAELGRRDIEEFVQMFDGVTNLANTFIKICAAGSILFKDWKAMFFCNKQEKVNAVVDFKLGSGKLSGLQSTASVDRQITLIREFLEQCLEEWVEYVNQQRLKFPELNYYTTEQLVILRNELVCLNTRKATRGVNRPNANEQRPSPEILALLYDVAPDCDNKMLRNAFSRAKKAIAAECAGGQQNPTRFLELKTQERPDENAELMKLKNQLEKEDFPQKIIHRAIYHTAWDDIDQLSWNCEELMEKGIPDEDQTEGDNADNEPLDDTFVAGTSLHEATKSYFTRLTSKQKGDLFHQLRELWELYIGSASMSTEDYFSVEHLGYILRSLNREQPINRKLPTFVKSGVPNLITCPEYELITHVLSLYMENPDLPMPDREEILFCGESTTLEEIELLMWRAVQDKNGRIYTLVSVDRVRYEIAGSVEKAIDRVFQGHDDYRFVVVVSAERESTSDLVAALDAYRLSDTVPQNKDSVRRYLQKHLVNDRNPVIQDLDPERFSTRVVRSDNAGDGKSLWIKNKAQRLCTISDGADLQDLVIRLPLHGCQIDELQVLQAFVPHVLPPNRRTSRIFHIDLPQEMYEGVDKMLFNLLILGSLVDPAGFIWHRSKTDYYLIETTPLPRWALIKNYDGRNDALQILDLLPSVCCRSPLESLHIYQKAQKNPGVTPRLRLWHEFDQLMDRDQFIGVHFQRVYQYLHMLQQEDVNLGLIDPGVAKGSEAECVAILLRFCGLENPSWAELNHFVGFLNLQLETCEQSSFCNLPEQEEEAFLPGFLTFVVRFMIHMSRDFATRSLQLAQNNPLSERRILLHEDDAGDLITQYELKRRWEQSPHPYIFFNPDADSMTFLGFYIRPPAYDVIDAQTRQVIDRQIMTEVLFRDLQANGVNLAESFDHLTRDQKLLKLCMVMGVEPHDPDEKYVLTTDNVKKILAIQMRFRCGIPVVIMGETGCGKTHLIKFMCKLESPPGENVNNLILMKVHGGTTEDDIIMKINKASEIARRNSRRDPPINTVLFLDEVNTTEALGLVKEVLCDFTLKGRPFSQGHGLERLKLVAACNPYRKHSDEIIEKLEKAGLGYHVSAEKTKDRLGRIPMRRLVYRVQPLPQSLLPLVWDFGQLSQPVEKMYIHQIVQRKMGTGQFGNRLEAEIEMITNILVAAQDFMRRQQDECSFVSLRDVERVMEVLAWFYGQVKLFKAMDDLRQKKLEEQLANRLPNTTKRKSPRRMHPRRPPQAKRPDPPQDTLEESSEDFGVMGGAMGGEFHIPPPPSRSQPSLLPDDDRVYRKTTDLKEQEGKHPKSQIRNGPMVQWFKLFKGLNGNAGQRISRQDPQPLSVPFGGARPKIRTTEQTENPVRQSVQDNATRYAAMPQLNPSPVTGVGGQPARETDHWPRTNDHGDSSDEDFPVYHPPDEVCRSLMLAIGVCYHACLHDTRGQFRDAIAPHFTDDFHLPNGSDTILENIELCQDVILNEIEPGKDIAHNQALKENVFMMVVCIELRIPLFLVGKPGSSKSLAKTIVVNAMQGRQSKSELFRSFKEVTMVSYQCSPLSTPDGIVDTFSHCAALQKGKGGLNKFVAVVVLEEIGLAEDSPRMPLKALHPLLEDGCPGDEEAEAFKKVGFIGISNWALDPAKMNRGILVQRGPPDEKELKATARGICSSIPLIEHDMDRLVAPLARAYLHLYDSAIQDRREFFGLRDFYSLVKMVFGFAKKFNTIPSWRQVEHAVLRNFGGLVNLLPVQVFRDHLQHDLPTVEGPSDPDNSIVGLVKASLIADGLSGESRYLLLLTENYAALSILIQNLEVMRDAVTIFGSGFPKDQEYTVVCRNINRIKVCMETGQTVVLLNLEALYESLYDALNQFYAKYGGSRWVDLGLGGHRVKARVHKDFKLVVVAEKEVVYKNFPIPLINRLEKHFLAMSSILSPRQKEIVEKLEKWAADFVRPRQPQSGNKPTAADAFIGYHGDTCSAIVLRICQNYEGQTEDDIWAQEVLAEGKAELLWCATPESVLRTRKTMVSAEEKKLMEIYFSEQHHGCLADYLHGNILGTRQDKFVLVTTHSRIMSNKNIADLAQHLQLPPKDAVLKRSLQAFDTEQQFSKMFRSYFREESETDQIMIIQCDKGDQNAELIACARFIIQDEYKQHREEIVKGNPASNSKHVVFIVHLPRVAGGCFVGLEGGRWQSVYLDDLQRISNETLDVSFLLKHSVCTLVAAGAQQPAPRGPAPPGGDGGGEQEERVKPLEDTTAAVEDVLKQSILAAVSRVRDQRDTTNSTARISKLFKLFSQGNQIGMSFKDVMKNRVYLLLREKQETHMNEVMAKSWLINDAASPDSINRAGTFRRAISMCLQTKVTPLLAGLVAYVDANNNLDILLQEDATNWTMEMWLDMLQDPEVTSFSYTDVLSPKDNTELAEMTVHMFGAEGHRMTASLPFSWLIKRKIDALIHQQRGASGEADAQLQAVSHLLKETKFWPHLYKAMTAAGWQEFTECYLDDFIKMIYRPRSSAPDREFEVVKLAVKKTAGRLVKRSRDKAPDGRLPEVWYESQLPQLHIAEAAIHRRLQIFSHLASCCPDVIEETADFFEQPDDPLVATDEMTLDIVGLHLVLDRLQPSAEVFRDAERLQKWHEQIGQLEPVFNDAITGSQRVETSGLGSYGPLTSDFLNHLINDWQRISVVKLFMDIIYPQGSRHEKTCTRSCPMLWKKLKDKSLKSETTMKDIEKFLLLFLRNVGIEIFGDDVQCGMCKDLGGNLLLLPCKHSVCEPCITQLQQGQDFGCPRCKKIYGRQANIGRLKIDRGQLEILQASKRRCNTFLMEVVSRYCFNGEKPPEPGLVKMLMQYISPLSTATDIDTVDGTSGRPMKTKKMDLFDDNLDPTPVIRSGILQLLLRSNLAEVRAHLTDYFTQTRQQLSEQDRVELAIIYTQCLEDHFHQDLNAQNQVANPAEWAVTMFTECREELPRPEDQLSQLEVTAKIRFALAITAKALAGENNNDDAGDVPMALARYASTICASKGGLPGMYLIRLLARDYGIDTLYQIAARPGLEWVLPHALRPREDDVLPDVLVACGEPYHETRQRLSQVLINPENTQGLTEWLNGTENVASRSRAYLLALFSEVTSANAQTDRGRRPTAQTLDVVGKIIRESPGVRQKELAEALVNNALVDQCAELEVRPGMPNRSLSIIQMITHFAITMSTVGEAGILQPLVSLITNPRANRHIFLPTMPEDERAEIVEALLGARHLNRNENPSLYECPNGHSYFIGNCGRPVYTFNCRECGAVIGGRGHREHAGNRRVQDVTDRTRPGHVLGDPSQHRGNPETQRDLNPPALSLVRLLVHLALFCAANTNTQAVAELMTPRIDGERVSKFLWRHIECNIKMMTKALGKSNDDCLTLVHILINSLQHTRRVTQDIVLNNKARRREWETAFCNEYIRPIMDDLDGVLHRANALISQDRRLGPNRLLKVIHETEDDTAGAEAGAGAGETRLYLIPALWRYRTRVTLAHLTQELNKTQRQQEGPQTEVLRLFLEKEPELRVVQLLPRILRLVRRLSSYYHRKLNRADAEVFTFCDFLCNISNDAEVEEYESLFEDYCYAWKTVQTHLSTHVISDHVLPTEYCDQRMDEDTKLSTLLPSDRGRGLSSLALIHYLTKVHNEFLTTYCELTHDQMVPEVSFTDLTPAHLITYDIDKDLFPLVLANCSYSLELGHGTRIEYDFPSLQQHLVERLIRGRSPLTFQLEPVTYAEDMSSATLFSNLEKKIHQVEIATEMKMRIINELKNSVEVTDCLSKLNMTLGFLVAVGGASSTKLHTFMGETLQMNQTHLCNMAKRFCELQHTRSLWLLYSHEREKMVALHKQEAFTSVDASRYMVPLTVEQKGALTAALRRMNVGVFLAELYEAIVLHFIVKQNTQDADFVDNTKQKLSEALYGYIDSKDGPEIHGLLEDTFPEITVEQCVDTWRDIFHFYSTHQKL